MTAEAPQTGIRRFVPELLHEQEFRRFWFGQTISAFGDQFTYLALPIVAVLILKADAAQMGLLTAVGLLPHLLFSLPAGIWLDRVHERRRLMIVADIGRAMGLALVPLGFVFHWLSIELLFGVAFLIGTLAVVFDISWNTFFVAVAKREQYVQASSLLSGSRSLSSVAGPAIAGVLIQVLSAPITILADALSFLGSAFFLARIHAAEPPIDPEPGTIREQLRDGLSFIRRALGGHLPFREHGRAAGRRGHRRPARHGDRHPRNALHRDARPAHRRAVAVPVTDPGAARAAGGAGVRT